MIECNNACKANNVCYEFSHDATTEACTLLYPGCVPIANTGVKMYRLAKTANEPYIFAVGKANHAASLFMPWQHKNSNLECSEWCS